MFMIMIMPIYSIITTMQSLNNWITLWLIWTCQENTIFSFIFLTLQSPSRVLKVKVVWKWKAQWKQLSQYQSKFESTHFKTKTVSMKKPMLRVLQSLETCEISCISYNYKKHSVLAMFERSHLHLQLQSQSPRKRP